MTGTPLVLCAVDFSSGSRVALTTAAWLSRRLGARLAVATVVDTLLAQTQSAVHLGRGRVDDARERVRQFAVGADPSSPADDSQFLAAIGPVAQTIIRLAHEADAAFVVVGARGRGAHAAWIGSTTSRLLRDIDRPVLVVPEAASAPGLDRIVCGVDFSEASDAASARAAMLATALDVPLLLLHAVIAPDEPSMLSDLAVRLVTDRLIEKRALLARSGQPTIDVFAAVGEPATTLIAHAAGDGRRWIALGLGTDDPRARPGTIALRVLTVANVPVLTVPARDRGRQ